jgi:hypothetical protein
MTTFLVLTLLLLAAACNKSGGSSPTATARAYFDASKAKDVQGLKNTLSKKSLALVEDMGKIGNKTLDESLKEMASEAKPTATFETRNEKITGETATIEVKDERGKWEPLPFVKEDGQWKIALDQAFEKAMQQQQVSPEIQAPHPVSPPTSPEKKEGEQSTQEDEDAKP